MLADVLMVNQSLESLRSVTAFLFFLCHACQLYVPALCFHVTVLMAIELLTKELACWQML